MPYVWGKYGIRKGFLMCWDHLEPQFEGISSFLSTFHLVACSKFVTKLLDPTTLHRRGSSGISDCFQGSQRVLINLYNGGLWGNIFWSVDKQQYIWAENISSSKLSHSSHLCETFGHFCNNRNYFNRLRTSRWLSSFLRLLFYCQFPPLFLI